MIVSPYDLLNESVAPRCVSERRTGQAWVWWEGKREEQKSGTDHAERANPREAGGVYAPLPSFLRTAKTTAATQHLAAGAVAQISLTPSTPEGFYQVLPLLSAGFQPGSLRKGTWVTSVVDKTANLSPHEAYHQFTNRPHPVLPNYLSGIQPWPPLQDLRTVSHLQRANWISQ